MYPYGYYPEYLPVQSETYVPYDYSYTDQQDVYDVYDIDRQRPQIQDLERRIRQLERQNEIQSREITRLNQTVERHSRRLNRLNQRLRAIEDKLRIPFSPLEDGF